MKVENEMGSEPVLAQMRKPSFGWKWIVGSLRLRRRQLAGVMAFAVIGYIAGLAFPIVTQKLVDTIISGQAGYNITIFALIGLLAVLSESIVFSYRQKLIIELAAFLDRRISRLTFTHLLRVRVDGSQFRSGEIMNHFQQVTKIRDFVLYQVPYIILDTGGAIVALCLTYYYDWFVGLLLTLALPGIALLAGNQIGMARQASEGFYKALGIRHSTLSESVNGLTTIKALAVEVSRLRRWEIVTESMLAELRKIMNINRSYLVRAQIASRFISILVIGVGCWRLFGGYLTVGELVALQLLASRITGPVLASGDVHRAWQEVSAAIRQVSEFLTLPREIFTSSRPHRSLSRTNIVVSNVSLTYPGCETQALNNISFELPEKGVVAIVGRNGSGKTTLLKILLGLRQDYSGSVTIGGEDLRKFDIRWLRGQMSSVEQDTILFSGTVRENIDGTQRSTDDQLWEALHFAGASTFIEAMPKGLDAEITENGLSLSGGQRQRLSIARAVIRKPMLVFLDEPTAFLDPEAAQDLERKLAGWGKDRLLVLVTHHLTAAKNADMIAVLDKGNLVGFGPHSTLISGVAIYQSLWKDFSRSLSN